MELVLGLALLAGTTLADPVGRLLLLVAGAVALLVGARDLLLRPVLSADDSGLTVVDGLRWRTAPWGTVAALAVITDRRTPLLSVDLGDTLIVLSRRRLGAAPADVLAIILARRDGV
jgi:hypothetical protein